MGSNPIVSSPFFFFSSANRTSMDAAEEDHGAFYVVFFTQTLSLFASSTAAFSLRVFLFQSTGSITAFTMLTLVCMVPDLLLWPLAGSLADRCSRKAVMVVCDMVACAATAVLCW